MNWNLYHFRSRIKLMRSWSSDQDYIAETTNPEALTQSWEKQVLLEFNDCGVSHPSCSQDDSQDGRRPSVLTLDPKVTLCFEDNDVQATFTGLLEFIYAIEEPPTSDEGDPPTSKADVIQRIFYDYGGCGGQFEILSERDHAHDACPSEEAAFIRAAIDYANDSMLQPSETAFANYLEQP